MVSQKGNCFSAWLEFPLFLRTGHLEVSRLREPSPTSFIFTPRYAAPDSFFLVDQEADLRSVPGWSKTDRFEFARIVVKNSLPEETRVAGWQRLITSKIFLKAPLTTFSPWLT